MHAATPNAVPARAPASPAAVPRTASSDTADLPADVYRWGVWAAVLLGAALRAAHITRPFNRLMAWNEGHYAMIALNFDRYGLWSQHNEFGVDHTFSPGVPWLIWASFKFFGPSEWAARLPIVISGIVTVALVAALVRRLVRSEQIALVAAAFVAVAPGLIYYAQNVQLDTPSICCGLAGAVCMLRYRQTKRWPDALASGAWLALAVWFKFTMALLYPAYAVLWWPARPGRRPAAAAVAALFIGVTALPSLAWIVAGRLSHEVTTPFAQLFYERLWNLRGLSKALVEIPLAVEAHLFIPIFLLLLVGIPTAWRWRARLTALWAWYLPWLIPYLVAPWDSLVNRYYDLPATYLLTVPAALGLIRPSTVAARRGFSRGVLAGLALALAISVAYDLWDPATDRIARATMPHVPPIDPVPFYSARIVAKLPPGRTIVDVPQTMFYAGGDPAWIEMSGGDVRWAFDREEYDYLVLNDYGHGQEPYYAIDDVMRAHLSRDHYVEIAPTAWAHECTQIADLGGYRPPGVPYWSPARLWPQR
jgi:dolichyl-phosphate-mannose-protein mannosyltransferase